MTCHDGASSDGWVLNRLRDGAASRQGAMQSRLESCFACNGMAAGGVLFAHPAMSLPYSLLKHDFDFPDWGFLGCFFSEKGKFGKTYYCAGSDEPPPVP